MVNWQDGRRKVSRASAEVQVFIITKTCGRRVFSGRAAGGIVNVRSAATFGVAFYAGGLGHGPLPGASAGGVHQRDRPRQYRRHHAGRERRHNQQGYRARAKDGHVGGRHFQRRVAARRQLQHQGMPPRASAHWRPAPPCKPAKSPTRTWNCRSEPKPKSSAYRAKWPRSATTAMTISGVITHENIESLPVNGRSFLQLSMLEPGVSVTPNNVGQYNKQFDVSILGASSANNSVRITVDGATVQDSITGGTQQNFSQEVVQEFQLSSTNFDLSTGIGAGGAINVVTRSGGNDFHGSVFFFYRDHNMSAFPTSGARAGRAVQPLLRPQARRLLDRRTNQERQAVFLFQPGAYRPDRPVQRLSRAIRCSRRLGPTPPARITPTNSPSGWTGGSTPEHNAFLRYSHDGNNSFAPPGIGDLPSDWAVNTNWADSGVFSLISVITPATVNEFRYSYTFWSNTNAPPTAVAMSRPLVWVGGRYGHVTPTVP